MESNKTTPKNIDEYILNFPKEIQTLLGKIRCTIKDAAPDATEAISYQMPTFKYHGNLVHFAAYEHHIGFYPLPSGILEFEEDLKKYKKGKGSIQFPLNETLPLGLITKIVKFRMKENEIKKLIGKQK